MPDLVLDNSIIKMVHMQQISNRIKPGEYMGAALHG
jgi:hypothetical protein